MLEETAEYMAELVKTGFRISAVENHSVALTGGLFSDKGLSRMLSEKMPEFSFFISENPPVLGAVLQAVWLSGENETEKFSEHFTDTFSDAEQCGKQRGAQLK